MAKKKIRKSDVQHLVEMAKGYSASPECQRSIVCGLVGHSRIVDVYFGEVTCARCGAHTGDTLTGSVLKDHVIVGHDCETCRAKYKTFGWHDKFMTVDPFEAIAG